MKSAFHTDGSVVSILDSFFGLAFLLNIVWGE